MNAIDLHGRAAVITGGASGLGLATARRFLQSGASVDLWDRDAQKLEAAVAELSSLGHVTGRTVDVGDWDSVSRAALEAVRAHKAIDILFNCAGVSSDVKPLTEISMDTWRHMMRVNLDGVFYCCRALLPGMVERGYGRIVNVSSMAGKEGNPLMVAYSAAKAGVIGLTKSLGKELATSGVLVNAIAPTVFETPLAQAVIDEAPAAMQSFIEKIPMRRLGQPEEAAAMVAWLVSADCSFTTGFTFDLSGGRATY